MMHMSTILDTDACVHDARMYVACIYDPRSLTLMHVYMMHVFMMHVFMMHISMIIDYDACVYDPRSLTLMHVCMMHISMILDPRFMHV